MDFLKLQTKLSLKIVAKREKLKKKKQFFAQKRVVSPAT